MNNLGLSLKKFFTNKNTVTIIGVVAILVIMYFLYTNQVKKATEKVKVPVANNVILPETEVTKEDIKYVEVASSAKPASVLMNDGQIIGKYTGYNVTIPEDGMFYESLLVNQEELPGHWLTQLETNSMNEKQIPCYFGVNVTTTFGNSIKPGDYVDFYVKSYDAGQDNKLIYGKLFTNIKILAVTDGAGQNVFKSQTQIGSPSFLNFGLYPDDYDLFKTAEYVNGVDVNLIVIPHGGKPIDDEEVKFDVETPYEALVSYIEAEASKKLDADKKAEKNKNQGTENQNQNSDIVNN